MSPEGFEVTSDENGFRATASFVLLWADAFTFHDQIMGLTAFGRWRFPGSSFSYLYAKSARIVPVAMGEDAVARPIPVAMGMAPGEFWTYARVDVVFETPTFPESAADDAGGSLHLNPANPIYGCEQSVRVGTKADSKTGKELAEIVFDSDANTSPAEASVYKGESHLTLRWPYVPYVPWAKYRAFKNTVNLNPIFGCVKGELLFVGADIQPAQGPNGRPGRSVTVDLVVGEDDWNKLPHPETGVLGLVNYGGDTTKRLYTYKSFADLAP